MNKNRGLLKIISKELNILRGSEEKELPFKSRIIYSAIGHVAYSSLFDRMDDDQPVSIVHFKNRCKDLFNTYKSMYPEVITMWDISDNDFSEMLYDKFLSTGYIYHFPNRITSSIYRESVSSDVVFLRGISVTQKAFRSGWGTYRQRQTTDLQNDALLDMFNISSLRIQDRWSEVLNKATWKQMDSISNMEYLRIDRYYTEGYFTNKPNKNNIIGLARTGVKGPRSYFLCRENENRIEFSPLEDWLTSDKKYLNLANGCLAANGILPNISFKKDGNIVYVKLSYLLPPAEQNFFELYSWPYKVGSNNSSFSRIFTTNIFDVIYEIFTKIGYQFIEE